MPRLLASLAALAVAVIPAVAAGGPSAPPPATVFVLTGGGWGHTVGMSQWGAHGQALAGRNHEQILAHYYPGTTLEKRPKAPVRVNLAESVASVSFAASGRFTVVDALGASYPVDTLALDLPAGLKAPIGVDGETVKLVPPVRIVPRTGVRLSYGDRGYRGSFVVLRRAPGLLDVVNVVGLEVYLRGVVPLELPPTWPVEVLRAQAVAARTYALARLAPDKPWDLYADQRSQVYGGLSVESPATTLAIQDTAGKVLTYEGALAQTLYFSSSGGRTSNALDVFGTDVPYLRSVDDPWDSVSPHHLWQPRRFVGKGLAEALGVEQAVVDITLVEAAVGLPQLVSFVLADGTSVELRRNEVRDRLGVLSANFTFGVLGLADPGPSPAAGASVLLTGVARSVVKPRLERLAGGGLWERAKSLAPGADGSFSTVVTPKRTTTFRLVGSEQPGPKTTITVPAEQ